MKRVSYMQAALFLTMLSLLVVPLSAQIKNYPSQVGYNTYWGQRHTQFAALGVETSDIVMLGDDFIDRGFWAEFFGNRYIKNRGIAGDVVSAVNYRLDEIVKYRPSKIFLYIGKRDLKIGKSPRQVSQQVLELISRIHNESRRTKVYFISLLPDTKTSDAMLTKFTEYNSLLASSAEQYSFQYIDICPAMVGENGRLNTDYSYNSSSTLNGRGYYAVCQALSPYLGKVAMSADGVREDYTLKGFIKERNSIIEYLPASTDDILMVGNSITNIGEWSEFMRDHHVKNRGISSDMTDGVLQRLPRMLRESPRALFLMIGVNDLGAGKSPDYVLENILKIVSEVRRISPRTQVYVESLLPVNPTSSLFKTHTSHTDAINYINKHLREKAHQSGYVYIDIHRNLTDHDGHLAEKYSNDGLHLCWEGYRVWSNILRSYMPK